jgi:hypothetical protein
LCDPGTLYPNKGISQATLPVVVNDIRPHWMQCQRLSPDHWNSWLYQY